MIYHFKSSVLVRKGRAFYATLYQEVFFGKTGGGGSLNRVQAYITCSSPVWEYFTMYSNEDMSVVHPSSVSRMFSPQLTHIVPPFRLLQQFHWYKVYVCRTSYVEKCRSDYWYVTWVEKPSPANCDLVVPIVVCQVHQNRLRLWWTRDTTIIQSELTEAAGIKRELGNDTNETVQTDGSNVKYNMSV